MCLSEGKITPKQFEGIQGGRSYSGPTSKSRVSSEVRPALCYQRAQDDGLIQALFDSTFLAGDKLICTECILRILI